MELKEKIKEYILKHNYVTFAELEQQFPEVKEIEPEDGGCEVFGLSSYKNLILWSGWKKEAFDAIGSLCDQKIIEQRPTQVLTYLSDGAGMRIPTAKRIRSYKQERWLPVIFCKPTHNSSTATKA